MSAGHTGAAPALQVKTVVLGRCLLKNGAGPSSISLPTIPVEWHIAGIGDFNGDGNDDLVWEDIRIGQRAIWFFKNGAVSSGTSQAPVTSGATAMPAWYGKTPAPVNAPFGS